MQYKDFIEKCKSKNPGIFEVHHIEPLAIGGVDIDDNKIKLSRKDHYTAHKLLALEHPYNLKLQQAWWQVYNTHKEYASEKDYVELRKRIETLPIQRSEESKRKRSIASKNAMARMTPEQKEIWKQKISNSNKNFYKQHPEMRQQISESIKKTYQNNPDKCLAISKRRKGKPGTPHTDEYKEKMSVRQKGRKWFTDGTINIFEYECPTGFVPGITRKDKISV